MSAPRVPPRGKFCISMRTITITDNDSGQRFDKFLKRYFQGATTGFLYKMLRKKNIVLNGKKAGGSELLSSGDTVGVFFSEETFSKMRGDAANVPGAVDDPGVGSGSGAADGFGAAYVPGALDLQGTAFGSDVAVVSAAAASKAQYAYLAGLSHEHVAVVYEDAQILAVNKPAGILTQKERAGDVSLNEEILSYLIETGAVTKESFRMFHPSVSNRLDRNTTGLVLCGKTLPGQKLLSEAIRDRRIKKVYHTVVHGRIEEPAVLTGFLSKDANKNRVTIREKQVSKDDKPVKTGITPLVANDRFTLLSVDLFTGRPHQIRAHLSHIGHPVVLDPKYGEPRKEQGLRKDFKKVCQLLHAYAVTLPDGREFIATEPEHFRIFCEKYL